MAVSGLSSASNRLTGLASGLDTETLVKQMTALTKSKINKQQQKLDKLQWQQDAYRDVISKVTAFKDTYFNLLKTDTNLGSSALFGTRSAASSNSLVKVSAAANATETTYNISEIVQKAESASLESTSKPIDGINLSFAAESGKNYTVNFKLDGLEKAVTFTGGATAQDSQDSFLAAVNSQFSSSNVTFSMDGSRMKATDSTYTDLSHTFSIAATTEVDEGQTAPEMTALGLSEDTTSKIVTSKKLGELAFVNGLKGNGFSFDINGVSFNFDKNSTLKNVMDTVNNSKAGVKLSYDSLGGQFTLASTSSGSGSSISISQTSGNLLTSLFGSSKIAASTAVSSASLISNGIQGNTPADGAGLGIKDGVTGDITKVLNKQLNVTLNGVTKQIGLWTYDSSGIKNDFTKASNVVNQLNSDLTKAFGTSAPSFTYDETAKTFTLTTSAAGDVVSVNSIEDTTGGSAALLTALGFDSTNNTNAVTTDSKLFPGAEGTGITATISFGEGYSVSLNENSTIGDLVNGSNGNLIFKNGMFTLNGVDLGGTDAAGKSYLESIFGKGYNFPGVPPTDIITTYTDTGKNAIIKVNGTNVTNNTNNFTIDGTSFDVSNLAEGAASVSVTTTKDTTKATDAVKKFVEDYNALVDNLYSSVRTKYDKDYPPLTEEQRADMSDKDIEAWEKKAKVGLLYQDTTINKFLTTLRSAVNGVSSSGYSLPDMGITVSSNYLDFGKLQINETKLKTALDADADKVQKFFTNTTDGLATKVTSALNGAVNTNGAAKGSLVLLAGVSNTSSATENIISKQLKSFKDLIDTLQTKYEDEQERYWKQFTTLEKTMSSYNSQSQWLTSQFS